MPAHLPTTVAAFIATVNAGDTLGFLDSFTPGGVVDDRGRRFTDREAIRAWSDAEFIGARARMTVTRVALGDDTVEVIAERAGGPSCFTFTLHHDKIAKMRITAA